MHVIRFNVDPHDGTIYVDVHLTNVVPWFKRVWLALKYVFGCKPPAYGHYDSTLLEPKDYDRIRDVLNLSEDFINRNEEFASTLSKLGKLLKG